jgi:Holliday junction resolvase RusA-like endonuclease
MVLSSKAYREWHKVASLLLPKTPISNIIELTIVFYFPDARKTDLSNKAESIMDLLVDNGVIEDDNWSVVPRLVLIAGGISRDNPRAEITWQIDVSIKQS